MFCVPALFTCGTGLYLCQNSAVFSCSCWNDGPVPAGFTITFLTYNFAVCVAVVTVAIWTKEAFLTLQLLVTLRCTVMKIIKPLSFTRSVISTQLVGSCGRIPVESQQSWEGETVRVLLQLQAVWIEPTTSRLNWVSFMTRGNDGIAQLDYQVD